MPVVTPAQARSYAQPVAGEICHQILRTGNNTAEEGACIDTLTDVAAQVSRSMATDEARQTCETQGVKGRAELAECIVDTRGRVKHVALQVDPAVIQKGPKSFSRMGYPERRQVEEKACAALGLEPDSGSFVGCVNGLGAAIFDADNPPG